VLAFDRGGAIAVVTRLPVGLAVAGGWTADDVLPLPAGSWRDVLTGHTVGGRTAPATATSGLPVEAPLAELFARYPVALLVPAGTP
jgi:(1->4)-alpha-D-glucan 1-alpha-D-glucosylmutase